VAGRPKAWARGLAVRAARRDEASPSALPRTPRGSVTPLPGAAYPDWDTLYTDNVGRIYRLMYAKVGNRPDAEDLTSQVFLTAYGPLRATASMGEVRAYLTATARTVLAEHWRRTLGHEVTRIDPQATDLEDVAAAPAGPEPGDEDDVGGGPGRDPAGRRAERILRALSERHRQILVLRFLRGYTVRQAAAELGVTVANAKVLQHRALRAAAGLDDQEGEAS
jgi:RNA polymerase sigma-70 factor (ECF subfamily)